MFTGVFEEITRDEAKALATQFGACVTPCPPPTRTVDGVLKQPT